MNTKMIVIMLVIAVVCGGVGYKVGSFGRLRTRAGQVAQFGQMRQQGGGQMMKNQGRRHTEGEILSVDTNGVTVKIADGSSKIVLFSDKTTFALISSADKSKIVVGGKVDIIGDANSDGSVSASELRIIQ